MSYLLLTKQLFFLCLRASECKGWLGFYPRNWTEKEKNRLYELCHLKASACQSTHKFLLVLCNVWASAGKQKKGEGKGPKDLGHLTENQFPFLKNAQSCFLPWVQGELFLSPVSPWKKNIIDTLVFLRVAFSKCPSYCCLCPLYWISAG